MGILGDAWNFWVTGGGANPNASGQITTNEERRRTVDPVPFDGVPSPVPFQGGADPVPFDRVDPPRPQTRAQDNSNPAAAGVSANLEFDKDDIQANLAQSEFTATGFSTQREQAGSFNINKFRSEVTYNDSVLPTHSFLVVFSPFKDVIARPVDNRTPADFRNEVGLPLTVSQRATMRCDNIILPNLGLLQEQNIRRYGYGTVENVAYGINSGDVTMQFIVDSQSDILFFFEDWFDRVVNRDSKGGADMRSNNSKDMAPYEVGFKDNYACPAINVFVYDRSNRNVFEYNIFDAYPVNLQSINLSWGDENSLMKLNVTFAFTDFKINRPRKTKAQDYSDQLKEEYRLQLEERMNKQNEEFETSINSRIQESLSSLPGITFGIDTLPQVPTTTITSKSKTTTPAAQQKSAEFSTTVKNTQGTPVT